MVIRTTRLVLRPGRPDDASALTSAMQQREIVEQLARVPWPYHRKDADQFIAGMQRDDLPRFLVFADDAGRELLVGGCGVTRGGDALKIGYWVDRALWGRGIATEATSALLQVIHDRGYDRVFAEHKPENAASARVLGKLGFAVVSPDEKGKNWPEKSDPSVVLRYLDLKKD